MAVMSYGRAVNISFMAICDSVLSLNSSRRSSDFLSGNVQDAFYHMTSTDSY
jgi:hypothetical protein